jgi:multidrug resistance efflux pump
MEKTFEKIEKNIAKEIKVVEKKVEEEGKKLLENKWIKTSAIIMAIIICAGVFLYYKKSSTRISFDRAKVQAPLIGLSSTAGGNLEAIYFNEGDAVPANTVVAKVGEELIKTKVAGIVVDAKEDIGKIFSPSEPVVTIIDPRELRIVATVDENKGLDKIKAGQQVSFTVDAFGSKKYYGIVSEISPTSNETGVAFSISDKRPTQQFNVKVLFNENSYPELKNGMSAKITIFTR